MATPIYPASNNQQAIDLNISNANQFFTILQGGIEDFIPTYEGNGEIPSVAKALNEAAAYKEPLAWQTSGEETDLLQPREYNGNIYVPLKIPATFTTAPSNEFWRLYSEKSAQILIDNLTFTGDGVTTDFSVPSMVVDDPAAYFVSVDGVDQRPTIDYTVDVSTDTLSFAEAPPATVVDNISVTVLGALRGALADGVYETVSGGLAETPTDGFFNVVNSTDPEAFIDLYKNDSGSALLIDTYPNKLALDNAVDVIENLQTEVVDQLDQNTADIQQRTIYVGSVAEDLSGLSVPDKTEVVVTGWHTGTEFGGGRFVYRTGLAKSTHDGGKFISPTVPSVSDQAGATLADRIANFNAGAGETDPGGTGVFVRLGAEFRPENYGVFIYDSKGDAEAGFDSSGAFMDAVAASRGVGVLVFPEKKFINVGAGVETQPDGIFAGSTWQANRCALVRTQPGIGLLIQGGAAYQDIDDIEVLCSSALAATEFDAVYDNVAMSITPNTDNRGIVVLNTRVNLKARSRGHAGFNFQIQSTSANSNASTYDLLGGGSGACDCYINGTDDNISVSRFSHRAGSGFGALFWIEGSAAVRNWDCWIYNENGMNDPATGLPTQCYIGGAIESEFWIYSENQNSALQSAEILADSFSEGNRIVSARQNKDEDTETDSSNRWYTPSGDPEKPFSSRRGFVQTFRNKGARAAQREEATLVSLSGNDGAYGQLRGGFYGIGFSKSDQDGANREFETGIKRNAVNNRFAIDGTGFVDETLISKGSVESPTGLDGTDTPYLKRVFARSSDGEWAKLAEIEVGYISGGLAANTRSEITIRGYRFQSIVDLARINSENGDIEALRQGAGFVLKSPDGTRYRITVDNAGNLSTVAV